MINFPFVNYTVVLTAAHVLWDKNQQKIPDKIELDFQGMGLIPVPNSNIFIPDEYKTNNDQNFDYGLIYYDTGSTKCDGFGWSTQITDKELKGRYINVCGYPNDQMLMASAEIIEVKMHQLHYLNDTESGQSGSPLFMPYGRLCWIVIGIHTHGTTGHNSGRRLDFDVIARFVREMNCQKALQSAKNSDAYLSCVQTFPNLMNCQYGPLDNSEKFYIYSLSMQSSEHVSYIIPKIVVESVKHERFFIQMNHKKMKRKFQEAGGGAIYLCNKFQANYQFYLKEEAIKDGIAYSFICVHNPHYRIRIDATDVTQFQESGSGIVNCQYYETPTEKPTRKNPYVESKKESYQNAREKETIKIVSC